MWRPAVSTTTAGPTEDPSLRASQVRGVPEGDMIIQDVDDIPIEDYIPTLNPTQSPPHERDLMTDLQNRRLSLTYVPQSRRDIVLPATSPGTSEASSPELLSTTGASRLPPPGQLPEAAFQQIGGGDVSLSTSQRNQETEAVSTSADVQYYASPTSANNAVGLHPPMLQSPAKASETKRNPAVRESLARLLGLDADSEEEQTNPDEDDIDNPFYVAPERLYHAAYVQATSTTAGIEHAVEAFGSSNILKTPSFDATPLVQIQQTWSVVTEPQPSTTPKTVETHVSATPANATSAMTTVEPPAKDLDNAEAKIVHAKENPDVELFMIDDEVLIESSTTHGKREDGEDEEVFRVIHAFSETPGSNTHHMRSASQESKTQSQAHPEQSSSSTLFLSSPEHSFVTPTQDVVMPSAEHEDVDDLDYTYDDEQFEDLDPARSGRIRRASVMKCETAALAQPHPAEAQASETVHLQETIMKELSEPNVSTALQGDEEPVIDDFAAHLLALMTPNSSAQPSLVSPTGNHHLETTLDPEPLQPQPDSPTIDGTTVETEPKVETEPVVEAELVAKDQVTNEPVCVEPRDIQKTVSEPATVSSSIMLTTKQVLNQSMNELVTENVSVDVDIDVVSETVEDKPAHETPHRAIHSTTNEVVNITPDKVSSSIDQEDRLPTLLEEPFAVDTIEEASALKIASKADEANSEVVLTSCNADPTCEVLHTDRSPSKSAKSVDRDQAILPPSNIPRPKRPATTRAAGSITSIHDMDTDDFGILTTSQVASPTGSFPRTPTSLSKQGSPGRSARLEHLHQSSGVKRQLNLDNSHPYGVIGDHSTSVNVMVEVDASTDVDYILQTCPEGARDDLQRILSQYSSSMDSARTNETVSTMSRRAADAKPLYPSTHNRISSTQRGGGDVTHRSTRSSSNERPPFVIPPLEPTSKFSRPTTASRSGNVAADMNSTRSTSQSRMVTTSRHVHTSRSVSHASPTHTHAKQRTSTLSTRTDDLEELTSLAIDLNAL